MKRGDVFKSEPPVGGGAGVCREELRRAGIGARDSLTPEAREEMSRRIAERIAASPEFRAAGTVLLYRAVRGEVRLEALEAAPEAAGKRLVYPRCVSDTEMIALLPVGGDAWAPGRYGIPEPVPERAEPIPPEDIDLVICPGAAFDEGCRRLGMGAGFYDRYLERCVNARIVMAAFECQKAARIPAAPWDRPMEAVFTEERVYTGRGGPREGRGR